MTRRVVDASALVEYLLRTPFAAQLDHLIEADDADLYVPALCDIEVLAVLRRALLARTLTEERARLAVEDHLDLPLIRHGHAALLGRVLGLRANVSAYDATYVALAESLDASLVSADARLARAVHAHTNLEVLPAGE